MKVMVFTFKNTTAWWRHVADGLEFADETVLVSDLPDADIDILPAFYEHLRQGDPEASALTALGAEQCDDIIRRCRLLRILDRSQALRMIGAMWETIELLLDTERPDLFLCFVIDRYILDLFERALARRGIKYAGLAIGVLPDHFMFMARGEYTAIREPTEADVAAALATVATPDFVPNYVPGEGYSLRRFLGIYAQFTARWLAFEALMLLRRNPLDYRYLATRSPASGFRVRLKDWRVMSYLDPNWRRRLEDVPFERRVFVGLSVNPEAAIEYWVRDADLIDYLRVLDKLASSFGPAGFHLFVKDHPSQFGFRQIELYRALQKHDCVTFVPYEVPGQVLISECKTTFSWTGTIGLQAALAGRCAVVARGAYYAIEDYFVLTRGLQDIDTLPERVAQFALPQDLPKIQEVLLRRLMGSNVPGAYLSWRKFSRRDPECVAAANTLVDSLNEFLPRLAASDRTRGVEVSEMV